MHKRVYQVWLSYSVLLGIFFGGGMDNILFFEIGCHYVAQIGLEDPI